MLGLPSEGSPNGLPFALFAHSHAELDRGADEAELFPQLALQESAVAGLQEPAGEHHKLRRHGGPRKVGGVRQRKRLYPREIQAVSLSQARCFSLATNSSLGLFRTIFGPLPITQRIAAMARALAPVHSYVGAPRFLVAARVIHHTPAKSP